MRTVKHCSGRGALGSSGALDRPWNTGGEQWSNATVEHWGSGTLKKWKRGTVESNAPRGNVEHWRSGTLEHWGVAAWRSGEYECNCGVCVQLGGVAVSMCATGGGDCSWAA